MRDRIYSPTEPERWFDLGCWIDGHWGQYGPDRLIDIAIAEGWEPEGAEELVTCAQARLGDIGTSRDTFERLCEQFEHMTEADVLEAIVELSEEAETYLNTLVPDSHLFGWHDGEFFLQPNQWWDET